MIYRARELRRLWLVKIYDGDKEDPECPIREETVVAWNASGATRRAGGSVSELPVSLGFITWDPNPLFIESTKGPTNKLAFPSIGEVGDGWDF